MIKRLKDALTGYTPPENPDRHRPAYRAAVLVPLVCLGGRLSVILIHRTEDMGPHSGQMGLPGGMSEEGDDGDLVRTALREAAEELGIDVTGVQIVGRLSELITWTSDILVTPYVGVLAALPAFRPDPTEVQSVHVADIGEMFEEVMLEDNPFGLPGRVYPVEGRPVWGLTARVLTELMQVAGESILGPCGDDTPR